MIQHWLKMISQHYHIRIVVVGTNKAFKQTLINSFFKEKLYSYSIIHGQDSIYVFKNADRRTGESKSVPRLSLCSFQQNRDKSLRILPGDQIVQNGLISSYFQYRATKKQTDPKAFLIETNLLFCATPIDVSNRFQIFDVPRLQWEQQNYVKLQGNYRILPDIIVIAMDYRQYFKQNQRNVSKIITNGRFSQYPKVIWAIHTSHPIDKQQLTLYSSEDEFIEIAESFQKLHQSLKNQVIMSYNKKKSWFIKDKQVSILKNLQSASEQTPTKLLDQSTNSILKLKTEHLHKIQSSLQCDFRLMQKEQFNNHMQVLGQSILFDQKADPHSKLTFVAVILVLIVILTGKRELLVLILCLIIAKMEQNHRKMNHKGESFQYLKEKQWIKLYSKDGKANQLLNVIKKEIERRQIYECP